MRIKRITNLQFSALLTENIIEGINKIKVNSWSIIQKWDKEAQEEYYRKRATYFYRNR